MHEGGAPRPCGYGEPDQWCRTPCDKFGALIRSGAHPVGLEAIEGEGVDALRGKPPPSRFM